MFNKCPVCSQAPTLSHEISADGWISYKLSCKEIFLYLQSKRVVPIKELRHEWNEYLTLAIVEALYEN